MTPEELADLQCARRVLDELQAWQAIVGEGAALHHPQPTIADWSEIAAWHAAVPRYLGPGAAEKWLRSQRVQAAWRAKEPQFTEAQLAIAARALDAPQPLKIDDFLPARPVVLVRKPEGYRVNSGRGKGQRLTPDEVHRIRALNAQGDSVNTIAMQVGVSSRAVDRVLSRSTTESERKQA